MSDGATSPWSSCAGGEEAGSLGEWRERLRLRERRGEGEAAAEEGDTGIG